MALGNQSSKSGSVKTDRSVRATSRPSSRSRLGTSGNTAAAARRKRAAKDAAKKAREKKYEEARAHRAEQKEKKEENRQRRKRAEARSKAAAEKAQQAEDKAARERAARGAAKAAQAASVPVANQPTSPANTNAPPSVGRSTPKVPQLRVVPPVINGPGNLGTGPVEYQITPIKLLKIGGKLGGAWLNVINMILSPDPTAPPHMDEAPSWMYDPETGKQRNKRIIKVDHLPDHGVLEEPVTVRLGSEKEFVEKATKLPGRLGNDLKEIEKLEQEYKMPAPAYDGGRFLGIQVKDPDPVVVVTVNIDDDELQLVTEEYQNDEETNPDNEPKIGGDDDPEVGQPEQPTDPDQPTEEDPDTGTEGDPNTEPQGEPDGETDPGTDTDTGSTTDPETETGGQPETEGPPTSKPPASKRKKDLKSESVLYRRALWLINGTYGAYDEVKDLWDALQWNLVDDNGVPAAILYEGDPREIVEAWLSGELNLNYVEFIKAVIVQEIGDTIIALENKPGGKFAQDNNQITTLNRMLNNARKATGGQQEFYQVQSQAVSYIVDTIVDAVVGYFN